ncbi:hypothetical protein KR100_05755 [Synechococcus sp. KORDI-100]|uniref:hypothetical protein n=1 Tax=Synechococcus sp. KORDI-100 TaxID=1280380 RepID=UPI0004E0AEBC|nr:hypothetical protein [Synechococcus sp. KORDI-100]AII42871.1 hypothetical protein KR100_05755 [Synechococcus sp. KORDI-100]
MKLLPLIGSLLVSVTQVMVLAEPTKAEITREALEEHCWSNEQVCEALVRYINIKSQIWYEFEQYCKEKSNGWLTPKGISEGAEYLYRHNEPRDDWDGKLLAKE